MDVGCCMCAPRRVCGRFPIIERHHKPPSVYYRRTAASRADPTPMNALHVPSGEYRALAERVTELAAEFLDSVGERRAFPLVTGAATAGAFTSPLPEQGLGAAALDALPEVLSLSRAPGPRFFGYVLGSGEPVAGLADLLASVLNQNVTAWRSAPAAVTLERHLVHSLAGLLGCQGFSGSLCGGGSLANLMG